MTEGLLIAFGAVHSLFYIIFRGHGCTDKSEEISSKLEFHKEANKIVGGVANSKTRLFDFFC